MANFRVSELRFESRIGVGSRGQIFRATDAAGGLHAVKVLSRDDADTNVEVAALKRVQGHPNIIALEGPIEYSAESAFVVLEHCDTDLLELVMASGSGLPLDKARRYFVQLVKGLRHCHHKGVCHGDLKPENALIKNGVLKLCDFGSASLHRHTTRAAGSVIYTAPELLPLFYLHGDSTPIAPGATHVNHVKGAPVTPSTVPPEGPVKYDAAAADIWSLGVVLFVLLSGRPPFSEASLYDADFAQLACGRFTYPESFPPPVVQLLRHLLAIRPRERYSISDVYRDPWVTPLREAKADLRRTMQSALSFRALDGLPDDSSSTPVGQNGTSISGSIETTASVAGRGDPAVPSREEPMTAGREDLTAAAPKSRSAAVHLPVDVAALMAEHRHTRRQKEAAAVVAQDNVAAAAEQQRRRRVRRRHKRDRAAGKLEQQHTPLGAEGASGDVAGGASSTPASDSTPGSDFSASGGASVGSRHVAEKSASPHSDRHQRRKHHKHQRRRSHIASDQRQRVVHEHTVVSVSNDDAEAGTRVASGIGALERPVVPVQPVSGAAAAITAAAAADTVSSAAVSGLRCSSESAGSPQSALLTSPPCAVSMARATADAALSMASSQSCIEVLPSAASAFVSEASQSPLCAGKEQSPDAVASDHNTPLAPLPTLTPAARAPAGAVGGRGGGSRLVSYLTQPSWPPTLHQLEQQQNSLSPSLLTRHSRRSPRVSPCSPAGTQLEARSPPLGLKALSPALTHIRGSERLSAERASSEAARVSAEPWPVSTTLISTPPPTSLEPLASLRDSERSGLGAIKATPGWENQRSANKGHLSPFTPHLFGGSDYAASESEDSSANMTTVGANAPTAGASSSDRMTHDEYCVDIRVPPSAGDSTVSSELLDRVHPPTIRSSSLSDDSFISNQPIGQQCASSPGRAPAPMPARVGSRGIPGAVQSSEPHVPPPKIVLSKALLSEYLAPTVPSSSQGSSPATHNLNTSSGGNSVPATSLHGSSSASGSSTVGPLQASGAITHRKRLLMMHRAASGHEFSDTSRRGLLQPARRPLHGPSAPDDAPTAQLQKDASTATESPGAREHRPIVDAVALSPPDSPTRSRTTVAPHSGTPYRRRRASDASPIANARDKHDGLPHRAVSPASSSSSSSPDERMHNDGSSPRSHSSSSSSGRCSSGCSSTAMQQVLAQTSPACRDLGATVECRHDESPHHGCEQTAGHGREATVLSSLLGSRGNALEDAGSGLHAACSQEVECSVNNAVTAIQTQSGQTEEIVSVRGHHHVVSQASLGSQPQHGSSTSLEDAGFAILMYAGSGAGGTTGIIRRVAPAAQIHYLRHKEKIMRSRSVSENNILVVISRRQQLRDPTPREPSRPPPISPLTSVASTFDTAAWPQSDASFAISSVRPAPASTEIAGARAPPPLMRLAPISSSAARRGVQSESGGADSDSMYSLGDGDHTTTGFNVQSLRISGAPVAPLSISAGQRSDAGPAPPPSLGGGLRIFGSRASVTISLQSDDDDADEDGLDAATVMASLAKAAEERRAASRAASRASSLFANVPTSSDALGADSGFSHLSHAESGPGSTTSDFEESFMDSRGGGSSHPPVASFQQPWGPTSAPTNAFAAPAPLSIRAAPSVPVHDQLSPPRMASIAFVTASSPPASTPCSTEPAAASVAADARGSADPAAPSRAPLGLTICAPPARADESGSDIPSQNAHRPLRLPGRFQAPEADVAMAAGIVLGTQLTGVQFVDTPALPEELTRVRRGSVSSWQSLGGDSTYSSDCDDDDRSSVMSGMSSREPLPLPAASSKSLGAVDHPVTLRPPPHTDRREAERGRAPTAARGILGVRNVALPGFTRAGLLDEEEVEAEVEKSHSDRSSSDGSSESSYSSSSGGSRSDGGSSCYTTDDDASSCASHHRERGEAAPRRHAISSGPAVVGDASPPVDARLLSLGPGARTGHAAPAHGC